MATTKPRITVTLTERQHEVLKAISDNGGQSMSAFIGEVIQVSMPTLERMAETLRKIRTAQDEQKRRIADELDHAQAAVEPILDQVMGQFDLFCARLEESVQPVVGVVSARGGDPTTGTRTPVTNRGVTTSPSPAPKPAPGKASRAFTTPRTSSKNKGG